MSVSAFKLQEQLSPYMLLISNLQNIISMSKRKNYSSNLVYSLVII